MSNPDFNLLYDIQTFAATLFSISFIIIVVVADDDDDKSLCLINC